MTSFAANLQSLQGVGIHVYFNVNDPLASGPIYATDVSFNVTTPLNTKQVILVLLNQWVVEGDWPEQQVWQVYLDWMGVENGQVNFASDVPGQVQIRQWSEDSYYTNCHAQVAVCVDGVAN
jgi:hypothetical protein